MYEYSISRRYEEITDIIMTYKKKSLLNGKNDFIKKIVSKFAATLSISNTKLQIIFFLVILQE